MTRCRRILLNWCAPAALGGLLALAYEPYGQSWLVWIIPGLLLLTLWSGTPEKKVGRRGFRVGYLAGVAFFLINLKWLWTVTAVGAVVLAFFLGLFWGLWGLFCVKVTSGLRTDESNSLKRAGRSLAVAALAASGWVAAEFIRGKGLLAFSWNGLGTPFADIPVLAQAADLVGLTGLAFLPVFISAVLVQTVLHMREEFRAGKMRPHLDFCVAMLVLVCAFLYGVLRISQFTQPQKDQLGVVLVQQNFPQSVIWSDVDHDAIYEGFRSLTEDALAGVVDEAADQAELGSAEMGKFRIPQVDLVVWPEVALSEPMFFLPSGERGFGLRNESFLNQQVFPMGDFSLFTGIAELEMEEEGGSWYGVEDGDRYNSLAAFDQEGKIEAVYRKSQLVIYGEYIPFIEQVPLFQTIFEKVTGVEYGGNISRGESLEPFTIKRGEREVEIIPSICFEDTVAEFTRQFARPSAQVIVNVTNDGWFSGSEGALQHMANARFRSIELRRPMVRCANAGVTTLIQPTGSVVKRADGSAVELIDRAGWAFGEVALADEPVMSLYARWGDWFCWLAAGISLVSWGSLVIWKKK